MFSSADSKEAEAFRLISSHVADGSDPESVIGALADSLLSIPGLSGVLLDLPRAVQCARSYGNTAQLDSSALSEVRYGNSSFGLIRVGFDPQNSGLSSPVKVAHFAGQQIASVLLFAQLTRNKRELTRQKQVLANRLETRKVFVRAVAFLQYEYNMSEVEAKHFLFVWAKKFKKRLLYAAKTVMTLQSGLLLRFTANSRRQELSKRYARHSSVA